MSPLFPVSLKFVRTPSPSSRSSLTERDGRRERAISLWGPPSKAGLIASPVAWTIAVLHTIPKAIHPTLTTVPQKEGHQMGGHELYISDVVLPHQPFVSLFSKGAGLSAFVFLEYLYGKPVAGWFHLVLERSAPPPL